MEHVTLDELEEQVENILSAPKNSGKLQLIVRRPRVGEREILNACELNTEQGLIGDNWLARGSRDTEDGRAHPHMQVNMMNARVIAALAKTPEDWALAGDQFYVDFDLSEENIPPGTQLAVGGAILEITEIPHLGCRKFMDRFGKDAVKFVNSVQGKAHHFRGVNAKVVRSGLVTTGDMIHKLNG